MSRARSAIAVKTTVEKLRAAATEAFSVELGEARSFDDFFDAVQFCRPHVEMLGGDAGSEAWQIWQVGEWVVMGDLSVTFPTRDDALAALSERLGPVICVGMDESFDFAAFVYMEAGVLRRRLVMDEGVLEIVGNPVAAERGHYEDEFDAEEAERLWTSYGLPTFEYDPQKGPFTCQVVKAR